MRFTLIDRILELEPDSHITATKSLSMAEEYLADHFPRFPVIPGVLMLEAMTQTSAWLVRASEDFAHSMVMLREAAHIKYGQFLEPGQTLTVYSEIVSNDKHETKLKASGSVDDRVIVNAKLTLVRYNLADTHAGYAATDRALRRDQRDLFRLLYAPKTTTARKVLSAVPATSR